MIIRYIQSTVFSPPFRFHPRRELMRMRWIGTAARVQRRDTTTTMPSVESVQQQQQRVDRSTSPALPLKSSSNLASCPVQELKALFSEPLPPAAGSKREVAQQQQCPEFRLEAIQCLQAAVVEHQQLTQMELQMKNSAENLPDRGSWGSKVSCNWFGETETGPDMGRSVWALGAIRERSDWLWWARIKNARAALGGLKCQRGKIGGFVRYGLSIVLLYGGAKGFRVS